MGFAFSHQFIEKWADCGSKSPCLRRRKSCQEQGTLQRKARADGRDGEGDKVDQMSGGGEADGSLKACTSSNE